MKSLREFEDVILDTQDSFKKIGKTLIHNMGKLIAVFVSILMLAITFTDISFLGFFNQQFTSSLALLLTSSYIVYFSLENAGEKSAELTDEYKNAKIRYDSLREKAMEADVEALRDFCIYYSERELEYRRKNALISRGLSNGDFSRYKNGEHFEKDKSRFLKKIDRLKPIIITPKALLCREKTGLRSELENPEKRKIPILLLKLIPSTVCMTVTLSVMLTAKEGLSAADVLTGILKLSALPMIGFKGYSEGYTYTKHKLSLFVETKANIICDFLKTQVRSDA